MSQPDTSRREMIHIQQENFRFHSRPYAGGKFAVEANVYINGAGWEKIDPRVAGNDLMVQYLKFIQGLEYIGYTHNGLSGDELKAKLEKDWGQKEEDWAV